MDLALELAGTDRQSPQTTAPSARRRGQTRSRCVHTCASCGGQPCCPRAARACATTKANLDEAGYSSDSRTAEVNSNEELDSLVPSQFAVSSC